MTMKFRSRGQIKKAYSSVNIGERLPNNIQANGTVILRLARVEKEGHGDFVQKVIKDTATKHDGEERLGV